MTENGIALEHPLDNKCKCKKEMYLYIDEMIFSCTAVCDAFFCEGSFQYCGIFHCVQLKKNGRETVLFIFI